MVAIRCLASDAAGPAAGLCSVGSSWIGLQKFFDWLLALPLVIFFYVLGVFVFWLGGIWSAALYKRAALAESKTITPAQTHA